MKRALKILAWLAAFILVVLAAGIVALQSPRVQTALGRKVVSRLESKMDANISFTMISIRPFDAIVLHDVLLLDNEPMVPGMDTVAYVRRLSAKFSLKGLLYGGCAHVGKLKLDGGCFNLSIEPDSLSHSGVNTNIERVFRYHPKGHGGEPSWGNLVSARSVEITDFDFWMKSLTGEARMAKRGASYGPTEINWNDLKVTLNHLQAGNLKLADSYVDCSVSHLDLLERGTGFHIQDASARRVKVGKGRVSVQGFKATEGDSRLNVKSVDLYGTLDDYGPFEEKVRMDIRLDKGTFVSMESVAHFADDLYGNKFAANVEGRYNGYVCDFGLEKISIQDIKNGLDLKLDGRIIGLPDLEKTLLDFKIKQLDFPIKGISGFLADWAPGTELDLSQFAPGEVFTFNGKLSGPFNRMLVSGDISSAIGGATAGVTLRNAVDKKRPMIIDGQLETRNLNLGRIIGTDALGPVSLKTGLAATFGEGGPDVRIDSLKVSRLNALGYDYTGLSAVGTYNERAFDGRIIAADPNLSFLFQGTFNLSRSTRNAAYQFYASLGYADLHALNIDKREISKLSFQASSNFIRTESRDLLGDVFLNGVVLESNTGRHELGDIAVRAHSNDDVNRIRLDSDFMEATYVGDSSLSRFVGDIQYLLLEKELPALLTQRPQPWDGSTYDVSLKLFHAGELLNFLMPGLYVENKSEARLKVDRDGLLSASVNSGRLALGSKYIKDLRVDLSNADNVLTASVTGSNISLGGLQLLDNRLSLFADDNHLGLGYTFDNGEDTETRAQLYLTADLNRDASGLIVNAKALPSNIYYLGNGWGLSSDDIVYHGGDIKVNKLWARHDNETLLVDGGYSSRRADTLSVRMEKFNLSFLNTLTGDQPPLEGMATGEATILSTGASTPGLLASIVCDSTRVSGHRLGRLDIGSVWDDENNRFNLSVGNSLDGKRSVGVNAYLVPSNGKLKAAASFDNFELGYVSAFLDGIFSTFTGHVSGQVAVDGSLKKMHFSSRNLRLDNGRLALDFTRVPYDVSGRLTFNDEGLLFDDIKLSDGGNGTGSVTGGILLGGFKDIRTDIHVQVRQMHVLDLPKGVNPSMFGSVYATGKADVTGPFNKIFLNIDAVSDGAGEFHLPLDGASSDNNTDMLTFTEAVDAQDVDPYELMMAANQKVRARGNDLRVKLRVQALPDIQAFIDIDNNSLNASGTGVIELESRPSMDIFSLGGDYTLSSGSFHFSAMNLVSRDFTIQEGSSVRFNGEVMDTDLNVNGLYVTKASLSNLVSDDAAISRRTVNCGINITGKLRDPEIKFSIDVPDLNPSVQAQVDAAINTEDKVQRQFLYLLLAGSFLPTEESGITTNGSEVLYSNVSSIMSGQLNNIFQKLDIPLDLGLNYQATSTGSNIFDVALSTQLFNNRVIVNGTVGNKQLEGGTATSEVAGDIDIEIKLNRSGSLRLSLFSHSADKLTYYLDNSQRNGGGIAYQRDFDSFRDFFSEFFMSSKERERREVDRAISSTPNVVWQVDTTGKLQTYVR